MAEAKNNWLKYLYANAALRGIAFSLFSVFIPVYFLTLGFSLTSVIIYYIVLFSCIFLFAPISLQLSKKVGYKSIMITHSFLTMGFLLALINFQRLNISIYILALLAGIKESFYHIPLHAYFVRFSEKAKRGSQFGKFLAVGVQIAGLIGPLIGAVLTFSFGFSCLFYFSLLFIILATIPLFFMENIKSTTKLSFSKILGLIKTNKRFFFGTISQNIMNDAEGIIWPIFIYLGFKSLISVGIVEALTGAGIIFFTLFVGRMSDKESRYKLLRAVGFIYAIVWILRIYIDLPVFLYSVSVVAGFLMVGIEVPFQVIFYNKAEGNKDSDEFIIFREIPVWLGRMILLGIMLLFAEKFITAFVLAMLACLFFVVFSFAEK